MADYQVIIIGAGPAGSMAGYFLAKSGFRVLILEKSSFPRRKVCAGGLTHRAYQQIPFNINPVLHSKVNWGYVTSRGRLITTIRRDLPISYLVDRPSFDAFLLDQALQVGAECHLGSRVTAIHLAQESIRVDANLQNYTCDYLIGADGVNSLVAKTTGLIPDRKTSLAYEARLSLPANPNEKWIDSISFDFGTLLGGYGWIFPKKDHLNVGVCKSWPNQRATKRHLQRFINQHPVLKRLPIIDLRAFPVPLGGEIYKLNHNHVLLAGDAANLADPWLGEGLYYALKSARYASDAIISRCQGRTNDLSLYTQKINETFIPQFMYARRMSILVNSIPYLNMRVLKSSPTLQNMIVDLLLGQREYRDIWQELKTRFPQLVINIIKKQ